MAISTTTTTTTTGQSIPNVVEEDDEDRGRVANLTKLIDVELVLLMKSFEEAKRRIDPMLAQINETRNKFDEIRQQRTSGGRSEIIEMVRDLRKLKQTTSKLKAKIPFNLIAPEYQLATDPNVIMQPPPDPRKPSTTNNNPDLIVDDELVANSSPLVDTVNKPPPTPVCYSEQLVLWCFHAFPEGAFIKAGLLQRFVYAAGGPYYYTVDALVSRGFIKPVHKKHSSSTTCFSTEPHLRRTIKNRLSWVFRLKKLPGCRVICGSIDGEEDIIYRGSADPSTMPSDLRFLHLGKWQRSPTHHMEMPDPNLYFKYSAAKLRGLNYISFRGVSVMKELPGFITHLRSLKILDLKGCHHLEAIPSDIGNLWSSLTILDMSECYFLDHMPASLSRLRYLHVLKGFFVGETNNEESCTLKDLSSMTQLIKLNIYTSLKTFPSEDQLTVLQGFKDLRNLTVCWGGCSTRNENREPKPKRTATSPRLKRLVTHDPDSAVGVEGYLFNLEKLDLRGVPEKGTRSWLRPSNFKKLEKLYIRGGQLTHLRNINEAQKDKRLAAVEQNGWSVKYLRLRHLSKMQMDWSELQNSFPNLISMEKVECSNLTSFPCDNNGLWMMDTAQPPATSSL